MQHQHDQHFRRDRRLLQDKPLQKGKYKRRGFCLSLLIIMPFNLYQEDKFNLGGYTLLVQEEGITLRDWPHPFYTPFRTQKPADIRFLLKRVSKLPPAGKNTRLLFDAAPNWELYKENGHLRLDLFDSHTKRKNRTAFLAPDFSSAKVYLDREKWHTQKVMRPLLEILALNFLAPKQGLLIHGAAIRDHDRAYVFIGPSGAGKTTMSCFWGSKEGDYEVLGDERIILRKESGKWFVYGTPWPGMGFVVSGKKMPLSNIFFIRHGKKNQVISASPSILYQELFTQVFSSFWDENMLSNIAATCEDLISEVPSYQLAFTKNASVADFVSGFCRK
jgi:hypothetical protein